MSYKILVKAIRELPWHKYDPKSIIYLSWATAVEFAESLRCALEAYPQHQNLHEMALGELKTTNLSYGDYRQIGDHHEFLSYFLAGTNITTNGINTPVLIAKNKYWEEVKILGDNKVRAITIFSREQELPDIFKSILKAHDWEAHGFGFFKYYLERHIELDSVDGGHAELTKDFKLDETVLEKFYQIRLDLYRSLEN